MQIDVQLTTAPIAGQSPPGSLAGVGAWVEFRGVVRGEEQGLSIAALEYEAYAPMAERQMRRLLEDLLPRQPCLYVRVIHRLGVIRVGETAIFVGVAATHRAEAFSLLSGFMDRLKEDVPIWKRRALSAEALARLPTG